IGVKAAGAVAPPESLTPCRWYVVWLSDTAGSKSLPVPKKTYWSADTLTVAIDEKIGSLLPAEYSLFFVLMVGGPALRSMSNRQTLPSRSPRYAWLLRRRFGGPVAPGSVRKACLQC